MATVSSSPDRLITPGGIVLDAPEHVPAIWGHGDEVLWSEGEPLILAGPPGVGKTTLAQQVALARACVADGDLNVLGYMVKPDSRRRTLYFAADRPRQALRSMRRMVEPHHRGQLDDLLAIWQGPFDALADPAGLVEWLRAEAVGTVIFDAIKDVAGNIADGEVGAAFNSSLQGLVAGGIDVMSLHHPRKRQEGNPKPRRLDDLYGSQWLAAGAGSVLYLWGEAGDPVVELLHLKQPCETVGPLTVVHDHRRGISTATGGDVWELLGQAADGLTAKDAAAALFASGEPTRAEIAKARRKLDRLVNRDQATRTDRADKWQPAIYRVQERAGARAPARPLHADRENGLNTLHGLGTPLHAPTCTPRPRRGRAEERAEDADRLATSEEEEEEHRR